MDFTRGHGWQTLVESTLGESITTGSTAADVIVTQLRTLKLPASLAGQVGRALANAVQGVIERRPAAGPMPIVVRVLVPHVRGTHRPGTPEADVEATLVGPLAEIAEQGWGFFLIHRQLVRKVSPDSVAAHELYEAIELFLYREGDRS
jgi:hypothetical protein